MKQPKLNLLLTGDELMSGDVIDSNSAMIAELFAQVGLRPSKKVTVGDSLNELSNEISTLSQDADILIVNGGLGPTQDDKTAQALSNVLGAPLEISQEALTQIESWCKRMNYPMNPANQKQALLPKSISIIENTRGSAPGFYCTYNNCLMFFTPGVPPELKEMLKISILPRVQATYPSIEKSVTEKFQVFGIGESSLQLLLRKHIDPWPSDIDLGFRAAQPQVEVKLTAHNSNGRRQLEEIKMQIQEILGGHIVGNGSDQLPEVLVKILNDKNNTITTAESCTGGLIASRITSVSGSSSVFEAGFVTYSNSMKSHMIGVDRSTLEAHGAVSEPVVREMVQGALKESGSDWAVAVSGVAGPTGGSEEKPVGTVWIAWGNNQLTKAVRLYLPVNRTRFQVFVTYIALDLIRRELLGVNEHPQYFDRK